MTVLNGGRILRGKISQEVMKSQSSLEGINVVLSGRTELVRSMAGWEATNQKHTHSQPLLLKEVSVSLVCNVRTKSDIDDLLALSSFRIMSSIKQFSL